MKTEWEVRVQLFSYSNAFIKRKISACITWAPDDILFAFPGFDLSQTNSKDPCPQARSLLLYHTGPGLMQCRPETGPVGTASPDDPLCCYSFTFHHISFNFDFFVFVFVLFKISSSSRVSLVSSWLKCEATSHLGQCEVGFYHCLVCCRWAQCSFSQGVGALQTAAMIFGFWV